MLRRFALIVICALSATTLPSCYDSKEVDEFAYVFAIGIDKGAAGTWRLTVQFPTMEQATGEGKGSAKGESGGDEARNGYAVVSIDSPSFFTGIQMLNTAIPRRLNFVHTKLIAVSEEIAKGGRLGEWFAPIIRHKEIRRIVHIVICKGNAEEFIKENKPLIGSNLSKTMELAFDESLDTGFFPHSTLYDFYDDMKSSGRQPVVMLGGLNKQDETKTSRDKTGGNYIAGELPRKGERRIEIFGSAVFDGDKMIGELTGNETRMMLMARGEFERGFFTIPDPKSSDLIIPLDVRPARKPKLKIHMRGKIPEIDLTIRLEGDILAIQSRLGYEEGKLKQVLENAFAQYIKKELDNTIRKCRNRGVDVFKFSDTAVWQFSIIQDWEDYGWNKRFRNAKINTKVEFSIRRTGTQFGSSPIVTSEGEE